MRLVQRRKRSGGEKAIVRASDVVGPVEFFLTSQRYVISYISIIGGMKEILNFFGNLLTSLAPSYVSPARAVQLSSTIYAALRHELRMSLALSYASLGTELSMSLATSYATSCASARVMARTTHISGNKLRWSATSCASLGTSCVCLWHDTHISGAELHISLAPSYAASCDSPPRATHLWHQAKPRAALLAARLHTSLVPSLVVRHELRMSLTPS
jgi:hypothetical protein